MATLLINGKSQTVDVDPGTPLLWVIRERLQLTGTKFGCGVAQCGACTVHLDGQAVRSCQTTVAQAAGKKITSIEGLDPAGRHPLQVACIAEPVRPRARERVTAARARRGLERCWLGAVRPPVAAAGEPRPRAPSARREGAGLMARARANGVRGSPAGPEG